MPCLLHLRPYSAEFTRSLQEPWRKTVAMYAEMQGKDFQDDHQRYIFYKWIRATWCHCVHAAVDVLLHYTMLHAFSNWLSWNVVRHARARAEAWGSRCPWCWNPSQLITRSYQSHFSIHTTGQSWGGLHSPGFIFSDLICYSFTMVRMFPIYYISS